MAESHSDGGKKVKQHPLMVLPYFVDFGTGTSRAQPVTVGIYMTLLCSIFFIFFYRVSIKRPILTYDVTLSTGDEWVRTWTLGVPFEEFGVILLDQDKRPVPGENVEIVVYYKEDYEMNVKYDKTFNTFLVAGRVPTQHCFSGDEDSSYQSKMISHFCDIRLKGHSAVTDDKGVATFRSFVITKAVPALMAFSITYTNTQNSVTATLEKLIDMAGPVRDMRVEVNGYPDSGGKFNVTAYIELSEEADEFSGYPIDLLVLPVDGSVLGPRTSAGIISLDEAPLAILDGDLAVGLEPFANATSGKASFTDISVSTYSSRYVLIAVSMFGFNVAASYFTIKEHSELFLPSPFPYMIVGRSDITDERYKLTIPNLPHLPPSIREGTALGSSAPRVCITCTSANASSCVKLSGQIVTAHLDRIDGMAMPTFKPTTTRQTVKSRTLVKPYAFTGADGCVTFSKLQLSVATGVGLHSVFFQWADIESGHWNFTVVSSIDNSKTKVPLFTLDSTFVGLAWNGTPAIRLMDSLLNPVRGKFVTVSSNLSGTRVMGVSTASNERGWAYFSWIKVLYSDVAGPITYYFQSDGITLFSFPSQLSYLPTVNSFACAGVRLAKGVPRMSVTSAGAGGFSNLAVSAVNSRGRVISADLQWSILPTLDVVPPLVLNPPIEVDQWVHYVAEPGPKENVIPNNPSVLEVNLGGFDLSVLYAPHVTVTVGFRCSGSSDPFDGVAKFELFNDGGVQKHDFHELGRIVDKQGQPLANIPVRYRLIASPGVHSYILTNNFFHRSAQPSSPPSEVTVYYVTTRPNGEIPPPNIETGVSGSYCFVLDSFYGIGVHLEEVSENVIAQPEFQAAPTGGVNLYTPYVATIRFRITDPSKNIPITIAMGRCDPAFSACASPADYLPVLMTSSYIEAAVSMSKDEYVISRPLNATEKTSGIAEVPFVFFGMDNSKRWRLCCGVGGLYSFSDGTVAQLQQPSVYIDEGQSVGSPGAPLENPPRLISYIDEPSNALPTLSGLLLFPVDPALQAAFLDSTRPSMRRSKSVGIPIFDFVTPAGTSYPTASENPWIISPGIPAGEYYWAVTTPGTLNWENSITVTRVPTSFSVKLDTTKNVQVGSGILAEVTATANGVPIVNYPVTCGISRLPPKLRLAKPSPEWRPYPGECYGAGCGVAQAVPDTTDNKGKANIPIQILGGQPGLYRVNCGGFDGTTPDFSNVGLTNRAEDPANATRQLQSIFIEFAKSILPAFSNIVLEDVVEITNRVAKVEIVRQPAAFEKSPVGVPTQFKFAQGLQFGKSESKLKTAPKIRVVDSNGMGLSGRLINVAAFPSKKNQRPKIRASILTNMMKKVYLRLDLKYDETLVSDDNGYVDYPSFAMLKGDGKKTAQDGDYVLVFWADGVPSEPSNSFSVKFVKEDKNANSQFVALVAIVLVVPLLWSTIPGSSWILIIISPFVLAGCLIILALVYMRDAVKTADYSDIITVYIAIMLAGLCSCVVYVIVIHIHYYIRAIDAFLKSRKADMSKIDLFNPPPWYRWLTDCDIALAHYNYTRWLFKLRINKDRKINDPFPAPPKDCDPYFYPTRFLIACGVCATLISVYIAISVRVFMGSADAIDTLNQRFGRRILKDEEMRIVENAITQNIAVGLSIVDVPPNVKSMLQTVSGMITTMPILDLVAWLQDIMVDLKKSLRTSMGIAMALAIITICLNLVFLVRSCKGNLQLATRGYFRKHYSTKYTSSEGYIGQQALHFAIGFIIQFFLYELVLIVIITPSIVSVLFELLWTVILTLVVSTVVRQILVFLVEKFLLNGMHYKYPLLYHVWSIFDTILSCLAAPVAVGAKLIILVFTYVIFFARLDWLIFPKKVLFFDAGHKAYVSMLVAHHYHQNPIGKLFAVYMLLGRCDVEKLQPHIKNMMLLVMAAEAKASYGSTVASKISRKWKMCATLAMNPSLAKHRKQNLAPLVQEGLMSKLCKKRGHEITPVPRTIKVDPSEEMVVQGKCVV